MLTCKERSDSCEFIIKYNPEVNKFALGIEVLKNLNIQFIKKENSGYLKGTDILECDLAEAQLNILGKKDKMKLGQTFTFTVVVSLFAFLFIITYLHLKCRGHLYGEKDKKDKKDGEELVDFEDKEKN